MDYNNKLHSKLLKVQNGLKAPKENTNNFGGFDYRSCEDILKKFNEFNNENELKLILILNDEVVECGGRVYLKATATLTCVESGNSINASALAQHAVSKTKMDDSQLTGSTSSYARKYALGGLFMIDNTKDADATNEYKEEVKRPVKEKVNPAFHKAKSDVKKRLDSMKTKAEVEEMRNKQAFKDMVMQLEEKEQNYITAMLNNKYKDLS